MNEKETTLATSARHAPESDSSTDRRLLTIVYFGAGAVHTVFRVSAKDDADRKHVGMCSEAISDQELNF